MSRSAGDGSRCAENRAPAAVLARVVPDGQPRGDGVQFALFRIRQGLLVAGLDLLERHRPAHPVLKRASRTTQAEALRTCNGEF
jgi:hypothetical protein